MITSRTNPLIENQTIKAAKMDDLPEASICRQRNKSAKRNLLLLWRRQTASEAVASLSMDVEIYGLTKGQFSLLDLLKALAAKTGPCELNLSTWTASRDESLELARMKASGELLSVRYLVDLTFARRDPQACSALRDSFGADAIRVANCHAKFATLKNAEWSLCLQTSMNLNMNPRTEDFRVAHDPECYEFLNNVMNHVWKKQATGLASQGVAAIRREFRGL